MWAFWRQSDLRCGGQAAVGAAFLGFGPEHDGWAGRFLARLAEKPVSNVFMSEQTDEFEG